MAASKLEIVGNRDEKGTLIEVKFPTGDVRTFLLHRGHALYDDFAAHGFQKKIRDQINGKVDTPEAVEQVDELLEAFERGDWNASRNAEGGPSVGLLAQALMRLYGSTEEQAQGFISGLSKKEQADLRADPKVAPMIATIKAESASKKKETAPAGNLLQAFAAKLGGGEVESNEESALSV